MLRVVVFSRVRGSSSLFLSCRSPSRVRAWSDLGVLTTYTAAKDYFFVLFTCLSCRPPSDQSRRRLDKLAAVTKDCGVLSFQRYIFTPPYPPGCGGTVGFPLFVGKFSRLLVIWPWNLALGASLVSYRYASFLFSFFLPFFHSCVALPFRGVGVGVEEPRLRVFDSYSRSWKSYFLETPIFEAYISERGYNIAWAFCLGDDIAQPPVG